MKEVLWSPPPPPTMSTTKKTPAGVATTLVLSKAINDFIVYFVFHRFHFLPTCLLQLLLHSVTALECALKLFRSHCSLVAPLVLVNRQPLFAAQPPTCLPPRASSFVRCVCNCLESELPFNGPLFLSRKYCSLCSGFLLLSLHFPLPSTAVVICHVSDIVLSWWRWVQQWFVNWYLSITSPISSWGNSDFPSFLADDVYHT